MVLGEKIRCLNICNVILEGRKPGNNWYSNYVEVLN